MIANHLWQSTFFALAAGLLTLALRRNRAAVRYWIWLAASIKFLIPLSLLTGIASRIEWRLPVVTAQSQLASVAYSFEQPFFQDAPVAASPSQTLPEILFAVWLCGVIAGLIYWLRLMRQIRAVKRGAAILTLDFPIPAMSSSSRMEPGVFGVLKPVLILPAGIQQRLTPEQLEGVLIHELCHVRRRDNLTAAIHMLVELIFWFHPLVWWIRTRLIAERENACDEEVLRRAGNPQVYAEGILNVCRLYVESPLVCAAGVTGSDLKKRIGKIMASHIARKLDWRRKLLLAVAATAAAAGPIVIGLVNAPYSNAQASSAQTAPLAFEVASIKPNQSGTRSGQLNPDAAGGRFTITNVPLKMCIKAAWQLQDYQLSGGPSWVEDERYDIVAKTSGPVNDVQLRLMFRSLLSDRFKLALRTGTKDVHGYAILPAKNGFKLHETQPAGNDWIRMSRVAINGQEVSMEQLAAAVAGRLLRPVVDETGIKGVFDIKLEWTPDPSQPNPQGAETPSDSSGPSIFTALQEQLGLRLDVRKVPVQIYTIEHVERPSEN